MRVERKRLSKPAGRRGRYRPMIHPALAPSHVAVVTGGASGIGLAAAQHFAALRMRVCITDRDDERLHEAADAIAAVAPGGSADVLALPTDVGDRASVRYLHKSVQARLASICFLPPPVAAEIRSPMVLR